MGQQQLLLIVLGVIIVGIAVVVGINVFTASSTSSNRDAVISDLTNLASMAQQFYKKPSALGGGNNTFNTGGAGAGWTIPTQLATTPNGTYTAATAAKTVTLTGVGNQVGNDGTTPVKVTMTVDTVKIASTVINN